MAAGSLGSQHAGAEDALYPPPGTASAQLNLPLQIELRTTTSNSTWEKREIDHLVPIQMVVRLQYADQIRPADIT